MTYSFEKVSFELFDQLEFIQVDCLPTNKKVPFKHMTCNKEPRFINQLKASFNYLTNKNALY